MRNSTLSRREWLALAATSALPAAAQRVPPGNVNTVTGQVDAGKLGRTLMHEHILIDFVGAAGLKPGRYDREEAFAVARPYLEEARQAGCQTLVECTVEHLGRDAVLLKRLSESTGIQIITATGMYSARNELYIPDYARVETAEQLAARFQREIERGIGSTGIRPGIIKTGINPKPTPLTEMERKIARAAALAHLGSGLVVASHTNRGHAAVEQLEVFASAKAPPRAFIWVHAHQEKDPAFHLQVARAGAWVEFDGIRSGPVNNTLDWDVECVRRMKEANLLGQTLISQDAGWYDVGKPKGGPYRGYAVLFREFLPRLKASGFTDQEVDQLLIDNPARALGGR